MERKKIKEIILYIFFGGIVTLVNVAVFVFLTEICNIQYMIANIIAWVIAVAVAFVTNKVWVFESVSWKYPLWLKECYQFVMARLTTCIFDMGYMFVAVTVFDWNKTFSKIIANVFVIIANYVLSKFWIFKK